VAAAAASGEVQAVAGCAAVLVDLAWEKLHTGDWKAGAKIRPLLSST